MDRDAITWFVQDYDDIIEACDIDWLDDPEEPPDRRLDRAVAEFVDFAQRWVADFHDAYCARRIDDEVTRR